MYRILVVDDEEKVRVLIRKYAEFEGYEVEEAADGMSAIEMCRQEKFDLIVLDVMMPELDGFSACREIRKFSQIPVLMLWRAERNMTASMALSWAWMTMSPNLFRPRS